MKRDRRAWLEQIENHPNWTGDRHTQSCAAIESFISEDWVDSGSIIYSLGHSTAAMLAATRAPSVKFDRLPHRAFLISVPREFMPAISRLPTPPPRVFVAVSSSPDGVVLGPISDHDTTTQWTVVSYAEDNPDGELVDRDSYAPPGRVLDEASNFRGRLATRLTLNTIAYVTEHREQCKRTSRLGRAPAIYNVTMPRNVVVDAEFRSRIAELVAARDLAAARRALAHVVRGHWRNQAVGAGRSERKLTWVRPHRRGDESIGSVVRRIERIEMDVNRG